MEEEMDLRQYWEVLRKHWVIIVVLPLIAALTSGIISFLSSSRCIKPPLR
jgi:Capsular polysaccharide biosynthesis protein